MALTTGVVSQHTARRFFRQSCQEKLPRTRPLHMDELMLEPGFLKGRFYGQVCFMKKKNRCKNSDIRVAWFFSLMYIAVLFPFSYLAVAAWQPLRELASFWRNRSYGDKRYGHCASILLSFVFLTERGFITCIYVRDFKTLFESLGNAWTSEWGGDHGIRSIGSTLHWGPDAGHNCFQKTHGEK